MPRLHHIKKTPESDRYAGNAAKMIRHARKLGMERHAQKKMLELHKRFRDVLKRI